MAPRRVAASTNKINSHYKKTKKLTRVDVQCPVCGEILIKPVTLPCNHDFCSSCLDAVTEDANLVCPLCRVRISSWLRSATKSNKLINETYWKVIQDLFPTEVKNKLDGKPSAKPAVTDNRVKRTVKVAALHFNDDHKKHCTTSRTIKKHQQVQKLITGSNNRSSSIESECLYFKPIDFKHNPPSAGLKPIKVPTKRLIPSDYKILAPSGQNQIINSLESAFARLLPLVYGHQDDKKTDEVKISLPRNKRKVSTNNNNNRKHRKCLPRMANNRLKSRDSSPPFLGFDNDNDTKPTSINNNVTKRHSRLVNEDVAKSEHKRASVMNQEREDFKLAKKLQEEFNRAAKYVTRSTTSRICVTKNNNIIGRMRTSKVK